MYCTHTVWGLVFLLSIGLVMLVLSMDVNLIGLFWIIIILTLIILLYYLIIPLLNMNRLLVVLS